MRIEIMVSIIALLISVFSLFLSLGIIANYGVKINNLIIDNCYQYCALNDVYKTGINFTYCISDCDKEFLK